jgi:hypothetical protein
MFEKIKCKLKEIDDIVKDLSEPLKTIATTKLTRELWSELETIEVKE